MRIERDIHNDDDITTTPRNLCGTVDSTALSLSGIALSETSSSSSMTHTMAVPRDLPGLANPAVWDCVQGGESKTHDNLPQGTNKRKVLTLDQGINTECTTDLFVITKRNCASKSETIARTVSPNINLPSRQEHRSRTRDDLLSFFIESLSEIKSIPTDLSLINTTSDKQSKSTHVTAFASMMTCASFWDEFVSMDQETKLPSLENYPSEKPSKRNSSNPGRIDCLGGPQLDLMFDSLPRNIHDALLLADLSPLAIVITQPQSPYLVTYVNPAWVMLCGFSSADVVGCSLGCIQGTHTKSSTLGKISRHLNAKVDCSARLTNYKKSGESFENLLRIVPLKNADGLTTHFFGTLEKCC